MTDPNDSIRPDFDWRDAGRTGSARNARPSGPNHNANNENNDDDAQSIDRLFKMARNDRPQGHTPDIDAYFDNEMPEDETEILYEHIRRDLSMAREVLTTQRAIDALRATPHCPDFSASILRRVDRRKGLLSAPWINRIVVGRVAIAAGLLMAMGGIFALHAMSSSLANFGRPTPIGDLAGAIPADTAPARGRFFNASAARPQPTPLPLALGLDSALTTNSTAPDAASTTQSRAAGMVFDMNAAANDARAALAARSAAAAASEVQASNDQIQTLTRRDATNTAFHTPAPAAPAPMELVALGAHLLTETTLPTFEPINNSDHPSSILMFDGRPIAHTADHTEAAHDHPLALAHADPHARSARPIITDDCIYYMGSAIDRIAFETIWTGFTAAPMLMLD
ncbi:MAG: anti-sigma factor family protein [Phycisphaerales bacterium]